MSLIVSISGVRGVVGESLTPEVVVRYASAFAEYCQHGTVVVGRDGRSSGKIIGNIVVSTLLSMGCDVVAVGVAPTPTIQIAVEKLQAAGGISITASHNHIQWNGLKFLRSDGMFLNAEENKRLWHFAESQARHYASWNNLGKHNADDSFIAKHIDLALRLPYIQKEKIRKRRFRVVVDCVNASGGVIVPQLLRELGCEVVELNCDVSGVFAHPPEPIPENLADLCQQVKFVQADLGIAVDPDGDRLVFVTEKGEPFGEEYTITSVVKYVLNQRPKTSNLEPVVVVNLSTTRAVDDVAKLFGAHVIRTPVGEINVAQKMKEVNAIVGGEGSGGVILPAAHYGRDAIVGIVLVLQQLAEFGSTISDLKSTLPLYFIVKSKVELNNQNPDEMLELLSKRWAKNGNVNINDGVRIDFADSWVHLRKSNTEPVIRIIAEAPTPNKAQKLIEEFTKDMLTM